MKRLSEKEQAEVFAVVEEGLKLALEIAAFIKTKNANGSTVASALAHLVAEQEHFRPDFRKLFDDMRGMAAYVHQRMDKTANLKKRKRNDSP